jgi:hypothetical protein
MNPIITLHEVNEHTGEIWERDIFVNHILSLTNVNTMWSKYRKPMNTVVEFGEYSPIVSETREEIRELIRQATQHTAPAEPEVELKPMSEPPEEYQPVLLYCNNCAHPRIGLLLLAEGYWIGTMIHPPSEFIGWLPLPKVEVPKVKVPK